MGLLEAVGEGQGPCCPAGLTGNVTTRVSQPRAMVVLQGRCRVTEPQADAGQETAGDRELVAQLLSPDMEDLPYLLRAVPSMIARYAFVLGRAVAQETRAEYDLKRAEAQAAKNIRNLAPLANRPTEASIAEQVADNDKVSAAVTVWANAKARVAYVKTTLRALEAQVQLVKERAQASRLEARNVA